MAFENREELLKNVMHLFWVGSSWFVHYNSNFAQMNHGITVLPNKRLMNVYKVGSLALATERLMVWKVLLGFENKIKAILRASCSVVPAICAEMGFAVWGSTPLVLLLWLVSLVTLLDVLSEGILSAPKQLGKDHFLLGKKIGCSVLDSWFVIPLVWI